MPKLQYKLLVGIRSGTVDIIRALRNGPDTRNTGSPDGGVFFLGFAPLLNSPQRQFVTIRARAGIRGGTTARRRATIAN